MTISILSYGCSSAAGQGVNYFWDGLIQGADFSQPIDMAHWKIKPPVALSACQWSPNIKAQSAAHTLGSQLIFSWQELLDKLPPEQKNNHWDSLGIIFASTKGCLEDFIWTEDAASIKTDPLTPILDQFIQDTGLKPQKKICMSLACASSHGAFYLAKHWLQSGSIDRVLILAGDTIGPFVVNGFYSLRALTEKANRPFSGLRDGLQLGEATAAILLSKEPQTSLLVLNDIALDTEGHAITKSSRDGSSLKKVHQRLSLPEKEISAVIVHGTGTRENDRVEDLVLSHTFSSDRAPPAMGTKWSIGHTLGASGAMDFISACEMMRQQKYFHMANTQAIDPEFTYTHYKHSHAPATDQVFKSILVHSLGFGGIHGGLIISMG